MTGGDSTRPVRVAFVMHVMQVAGAEMLVAETIRRMRGRIDPIILCLDRIGALGEQLLQEGVTVLSLDRRPGRDWRVIGRLAQRLREHSTEVIHAHQYTPFFYAALARLSCRLRPRLIFTEHGRHFPDIVSWKRRWFNRLFLSHLASAVNACCAFSAEAVVEKDGFPPGSVEVIENGIDLSRHLPCGDRGALRKTLGLDPTRRYIACIARFHPVKDHATLLRGFAGVAEARPDVDLLLAGDGPERGALERLAAELHITPRVHFLGVRSDVPALLRAADVFALTSLSEAASLTVLEAMAARLPVVVTAVGGNPEIVRDGIDGLLVPRGDAGAVNRALLRLLDDPHQASTLGLAGRQRVEERYRLEGTVERYGRLYETLARGKA